MAPSSVRLATPLGGIDGVNTDFATPTPHAPGELMVSVDGLNLPDDEVIDVEPAIGAFRLANPPDADTIVQVAYVERLPDDVSGGGFPKAAIFERLVALHLEGGNDLEIVAGESGALIQLTILDSDGNSVDLTAGYDVFFMARVLTETGTVAFDKTTLNGSIGFGTARGQAEVMFTSVETQAQAAKILTWDAWVQTPTGDLVNLAEGARLRVRSAVRTTFP